MCLNFNKSYLKWITIYELSKLKIDVKILSKWKFKQSPQSMFLIFKKKKFIFKKYVRGVLCEMFLYIINFK